MADLQPTFGSSQKKIRKRGSNYTVSETVIIEEEYLKNRWLLEGKFSDKVTNARKQQVWEMITQKVNAAGSKVRTVEKIKEKWRAEMKKAKKEYRTFIEDRSKTGGGRPPADLSSTTSRIIDMYKETAGFCGIPGSKNLETFVMNDDSSCKDSTTDTCLATDERDIIEDIVVTLTGDNLENSSVYKPTSNEETEVVAGTSDRLQDIGTSNPISQNKETTAAKLTKSTLWNVFKQNCDEEQHLHFSKLRSACNALNLFPSTSQVHEMLMCAVEYGSPCKPDHITFGEFCVLVSELRSYYYLNPKPPVPHSLCRTRTEQSLTKRKRRVFLGGSCNPTQWRAEIAIPYFKENGITFYNPQVQHWKPELMELEAQAKQMADFLFFVIDSKTRAISSMIEVAYLIATQRQVVVTMCDYKEPVEVNGQVLSENEMAEIIKGRLILTDLIERNSVPIFSDILKALSCTKLSLAEDKRVQDLTLKDGAKPVKHGHLKLGRALLELREAFNSVDSSNLGYLTKQDVCLAYKSCTGEEMDIRWLEHKRKSENEFLYEEFCAIVTEHRAQSEAPSIFQKLIDHVLHPFHWMLSNFSPPPPPETDFGSGEIHDVYLGGSNGDLQWRADIVIPMLRKHGLSFVNPAIHDWEQKSIPIHVALRENCHLLFYVITGDRRSLGSMCEAGYYIGKGCRMVLCIHKIPKEATFEGEQLTEQCIKDYNRGRSYLRDLASTEGVPLFEDIMEATECVITMLNGQPTYLPSSSNLLS